MPGMFLHTNTRQTDSKEAYLRYIPCSEKEMAKNFSRRFETRRWMFIFHGGKLGRNSISLVEGDRETLWLVKAQPVR